MKDNQDLQCQNTQDPLLLCHMLEGIWIQQFDNHIKGKCGLQSQVVIFLQFDRLGVTFKTQNNVILWCYKLYCFLSDCDML